MASEIEKEIVKQILSWINDNPLKIGINWRSNILIAQRIISWIFVWFFFGQSDYFKRNCLEFFLNSIYSQTDFLFDNRHIHRNNHRIASICAIIIVGILFPEFKKFRMCINDLFKELEQVLSTLVFNDGVYREQTTSYEKVVAEFLLLIFIIAERNNIQISNRLKKIFRKIIYHLAHIRTPDGKIPNLGDNSDERAYLFSENSDFWEVDTLISAGAIIYNDQYLRKLSNVYTANNFWLFGCSGYKKWKKIQITETEIKASKAYKLGGHFVIKSDTGRESDYLFIRCGEFGFNGRNSHSHCDLLSIVLHISGNPVFIDSGTFRYNVCNEKRDYYRKSSAHNTMQLDDEEQSKILGTFKSANRIIDAKCIHYDDKQFEGYLKNKKGIEYIRNVAIIEKGHWVISDEIRSVYIDNKTHIMTWYFNLSPGLKTEILEQGELLMITGNNISIKMKSIG